MKTYMPWIREFSKDRIAVISLLVILSLVLTSFLAPYIAPYPDVDTGIDLSQRLKAPSWEHLFGTDQMGRDILSRIMFGTRTTVIISGTAIVGALVLGIPLGLIAGYYEGWVGAILIRIAEVFLSLPQVVLAMAMAAALGASIQNAIIAIAITYWPWWTRVAYAETLSLKRTDFVEATNAIGASTGRVLFFHIFPNMLSPIIVRTTIGMGSGIMIAAMLGYLGLGAQAPSPEWGLAVSEAREYLPAAWWFATFPGLAIFIVVLAFNILGDGLRDTLDPRLRISGQ
jgi:peptide/nickel transport system permease protein